MARSIVYVLAIMDWCSRKVLTLRVCNTMEADFCVEAQEEAISRYGSPEIFNSDQGAQFTSEAFTSSLKAAGIQISKTAKATYWVECEACPWCNVFVERLWRSLKYEGVYLKAYESVTEARQGIAAYFQFYNAERRHQGLNRNTPEQMYTGDNVLPLAA